MRLTRYCLAAFCIVLLAGTAVSADKGKIVLGLSYGAYTPLSSATRDRYDSNMTRFGITTFQEYVPQKWRFTAESGNLKMNGDAEVSLIPVTAGLQRGFGDKRNLQPYLALRTGPCYGTTKIAATGEKDSKIGWSANAAYGVIYKRRFYAEARYDRFTKFAGSDFSGFSISVGTRIAGFSL